MLWGACGLDRVSLIASELFGLFFLLLVLELMVACRLWRVPRLLSERVGAWRWVCVHVNSGKLRALPSWPFTLCCM